jgi:hypothetical protein
MRFQLFIVFFLPLFYSCSNNNTGSKSEEHQVNNYNIPDTTKGLKAKNEYQNYLRHKNLSSKLNLSSIHNTNDSFEARFWWEGSMYNPNSVYILSGDEKNLIITEIDYYVNFRSGEIDSFKILDLKPSIKPNDQFLKDLNLNSFWTIPMYYQLNHAKGCVDGETVTIEIQEGNRYKTISYPCYTIYSDSLSFKPVSTIIEKIMNLEKRK